MISNNFQQIQTYLHAYYVPNLHNELSKYKEKLLKEFEEWYEGKRAFKENNYMTRNREFQLKFEKYFYDIIDKYYIVDDTWQIQSFGIYVQDDKEFVDDLHIHQQQATITATTYIDPCEPEEGGQLELWNIMTSPITISPQKDYIYFFPSWLPHRPLQQTRKSPRICLNWGYDCLNRPIHRLTGDRW